MNRTSSTPYLIGSFLFIAVWLVWFIVSAVTGNKGRLGDISHMFLLWGGIGLLASISICDISVTEKGFTVISIFSKKDFLFDDIEITSIKCFGAHSSFRVYTTIKSFIFAYTKANCAALKEIIPSVKYSKISVEELEAMVKKAFFAPV
ncbi:hypothetical protein H0R92_13935 [Treponema sp. OMZ 840]|uniref:hypothetical protein n=1 Tax=Treponema sp. OMZ 840 TaxID=244313 RepID=UPI003D9048B8